MSIKAYVQELDSIQYELKTMAARRKKLKEREKKLMEDIKDFLREKDQVGVKHHGTAIILEEKQVRAKKKAKERDQDAIDILEQYGIDNPDKVLAELLEARKGTKITEPKLTFKKYKDKS